MGVDHPGELAEIVTVFDATRLDLRQLLFGKSCLLELQPGLTKILTRLREAGLERQRLFVEHDGAVGIAGLARGKAEIVQHARIVISLQGREQQDRVAEWLLAELADEKVWDERFGKSQDAIAKLADEALGELSSGKARDLDPTKL